MDAFRRAFRVEPEVRYEPLHSAAIGVYGWSTPDLDGFELPPSDDLVVALHLDGSRRVRAKVGEGLSRACSAPGLITVLPPGVASAFQTAGSVGLMTLHVRESAGRLGVLAGRLASARGALFALRDGYARSCMEALLVDARAYPPLAPDRAPRLTESLLGHLANWAGLSPLATTAGLAPEIVLGRLPLGEMLRFIDRHLASRLCLQRLAHQAGLSRVAFARDFKAAVGVPAHQFIVLRRIKAGARLLRDSSFEIAHIAQETGFSSQSHFTEAFRSLTGVTPLRFRNDPSIDLDAARFVPPDDDG